MMKKLEGKKLWLLVTAIGVAVVAVIAAIWLLPLTTQQSPDEAKLGTKIPELVPTNADMVVIAPAYTKDSQQWWESVSGHMEKAVQVESVKPYENPEFEMINYGYSRSVNPAPDEYSGLFKGPDQALYLESKTEQGAINLENRLKDGTTINPESDTASARVGNINIVSRKISLDHLTVKNKELKINSILERKDFNSQSPMMWVNFDRQQEILATGGSEHQIAAIKTMYKSGLGISPGTVWQSTSKDAGSTWNGGYPTGGVKKDNVDPEAASLAFESDAKTLTTSTNASPNAPTNAAIHELSVIEPGLSQNLEYISVQYSDSQDVIGNVGDNPPAGKNVVSADLSLAAWNNLTTNTAIGKNSYLSQSIRATEGDLTMSFSK